MTEIDLRGVSERDIDLFLLEEVVASDSFRSWFLSRIDISADSQLISAARSVTTSTGESDLEFTLQDEEGVTRVLVENKIDAGLQDRQAERYQERAQVYVESGECDHTKTVLIAPKVYAGDNLGFDCRITYESVQDNLKSRSSDNPRMACKLALLEAAIHRGSCGWTMVPDDAVTESWTGYWKKSIALAPSLRMPRPDDRPTTSSFVKFRPAELPRGVGLYHKLAHGNVDLQFSGLADRLNEFALRYSELLEDGMSIESAGKSLVVRLKVPVVRTELPIEDSEAEVEIGLKAADRLLSWYIRHQPDLEAERGE